jgi:TetR/AcrR family transcriptional regulator
MRKKRVRWGDRLPSQGELYERKRVEIVREAGRFFGRSGYHGTSLAEVAMALGLTKQALYYYFPDKQALLHACAVEAHRGALAVLDAAAAAALDPAARLEAGLRAYAAYGAASHMQFIMFLETDALRPEQRAEVTRLRDQFDRRVRSLISAGIDAGALRAADPKMMSFAVLGAVNWIARWWKPEGPEPIDEVAARIVAFAMDGIRAAPLARSRGRAKTSQLP